MHAEDFDDFSDLLSDVFALKNQVLTAGQKAMFFRALVRFPLLEVRAGLDAHIGDPRRGQFLPMPADVIAQIEGMVADDGRPGVEEAWSIAFRTTDESATVVWTTEIAEAYGMVRPLLQAGDDVAARMSFKEVYTRLLDTARQHRVPVNWSATLGYDLTGRDHVLLPHVKLGRLPADLLIGGPAPRLETVLSLPAPVNAAPSTMEARERAMAGLRALRDSIMEAKLAPAKTVAELDLERVRELKADAAAMVAAELAGGATA